MTAAWRSFSFSWILKPYRFSFFVRFLSIILTPSSWILAFWLSSSGWSSLNSKSHFALSALSLSSKRSSVRSYLTFSDAIRASFIRIYSSRSSRYVFYLCYLTELLLRCDSGLSLRVNELSGNSSTGPSSGINGISL